MKKLLYIILLLPLWVNAQTNGTIQKTSATGTVRGSFGSLGLDTLTRVTGALVNGYILKYHAATNKWYASPDPTYPGLQDSLTKKANRTFDNVASGAIAKSKVDTTATGLQTVSNFFPKGDTRYQRLSVAPTSISATSPIFYNSGTGVISSQAASGTLSGYVTTGTQSIAGEKTFTDYLTGVVNSSGTLGALLGNTNSAGFGVKIKGGSDATRYALTVNTADDMTTLFKVNGDGGVIAQSLTGSGDVITGANNSGQIGKITVGSGLSLTSGVLTATGGSSGSVTTSGGTAGKLTKFTSASNVENSIMTELSNSISVAGNMSASGSFSVDYAGSFLNTNTTAGTSNGLFVRGGTNSSDNGLVVNNAANTLTLLQVKGNGDAAIYGNITAANLGTASTYTATSANTALTVPLRDLSGNFSAGTITASLTGNSSTATALQTARNIQGVSFNGTADINPINGTGFVKATGTTLSYDNSTYLTGNQTVTLSGAVTGSGATSISTTLASGIDATKIADGSVTSTEFQYINSLSSNVQDQINAKAGLNSPTFTGTPTLPTGTIAVTQTAGDNSTKIATTAYVDGAISTKVVAGTFTFSGTGSQTVFTQDSANSTGMVITPTSADASGAYYLTSDNNGCGGLCDRIIITFLTAPASGTNNITFNYIKKN